MASPGCYAIAMRVSCSFLLRNSRKTERGAKQFLDRLAVRAAPFALRGNLRKTGCGAAGSSFRLAVRAAPIAFLIPALALAQLPSVSSHTLGNGLKVLVEEDHRIPSVAMYLFFRVGSRNERPGITGISHFFEHMMFNGAKKYGPAVRPRHGGLRRQQ